MIEPTKTVHQPVVFVVEDEENIRNEITDCLESEPFEVYSVGEESDLWRTIGDHRVDLFLLDIKLPNTSGLSILKKIRQTSDVGVIMLTGKTSETDRVVGLEVGADDYVCKPFGPEELLARCKSVLRRTGGKHYSLSNLGGPNDTESIIFDNWRVDVSACRLFAPAGKEVELTALEYNLLLAFATRPNRLLTREFLVDHIYDRSWPGIDRSIDNLVSRVRKKFRRFDPRFDAIKTIHGKGYRFDASVMTSNDK